MEQVILPEDITNLIVPYCKNIVILKYSLSVIKNEAVINQIDYSDVLKKIVHFYKKELTLRMRKKLWDRYAARSNKSGKCYSTVSGKCCVLMFKFTAGRIFIRKSGFDKNSELKSIVEKTFDQIGEIMKVRTDDEGRRICFAEFEDMMQEVLEVIESDTTLIGREKVYR